MVTPGTEALEDRKGPTQRRAPRATEESQVLIGAPVTVWGPGLPVGCVQGAQLRAALPAVLPAITLRVSHGASKMNC